jgi:hypothetical protein
LKSDRLALNQIDLVDIDLAGGWMRGTTWAHLYSPRTRTYDLVLRPQWPPRSDPATRETALSWHGLPGRGFGGMESTALSAFQTDLYQMKVHLGSPGGWRVGLQGLPVAVRSSRSLLGQWWCRGAVDPTSRLAASADGELRGSLRNPLPVTLDQCLLVHGRWAYPVGRLEPSAARSVEQLTRLRRLEDVLVRRSVDLTEMKSVSDPWDPQSVDVPRIMEMVMFYRAAGGQAYTKLLHRYQGGLDLSDQLTMGRAVLVGHCGQQRAALASHGAAVHGAGHRHGTLYRIVYPVDFESAESSSTRQD